MSQDEILDKVTEVFRATFDDRAIGLTMDTTASDIPRWDSFIHITLVIEIEQAFGIRFEMQEIETLTNVGTLVDLIAIRLRAAG